MVPGSNSFMKLSAFCEKSFRKGVFGEIEHNLVYLPAIHILQTDLPRPVPYEHRRSKRDPREIYHLL